MNNSVSVPQLHQTISIRRLSHAAELPLPHAGTALSAGYDLCAAIDDEIIIQPRERAVIPTGYAIALRAGLEAQIRSRSGLSVRNGVVVLNAPGTIDADYRGEILVILMNHGEQPFSITRGMRIAQLVVAPYVVATWDEDGDFDNTDRGEKRFGSTGV